MSILAEKSLWARTSSDKLLSFVRKVSTFVPKYKALATLSLSLESYCEESGNERVYSMNRNLDSLMKSGRFDCALKLFDEMPIHDVVSYNLVISGHRQYGSPREAIQIYAEMVSRGIRESSSSFSSVFGMCSDGRFYEEGIQVHCRAVSLGFISNVFVGSAVVNLYMAMGLGNSAVKLFYELPSRNLATWNSMLRGLCDMARADEMLGSFSKMNRCGLEPNGLTFSYLIRGCCGGRCFDEGKQLHCHVIKAGLVETNIFVANVLVDFYSACECLIETRKAFEAIPLRDVISWNSLVWVFANEGLFLDALEAFSAMRFWGNKPSIRSLSGLLNLASGTEDVVLGKLIHSYAVKSGFVCGSVHVRSALINMYGKCGEIGSSVVLYESAERRTLECCNSLMTSLLHCGYVDDAVEMFGLMVDECIGLDEVSLSTALKALSVSSLGSSKTYKLLHSCAVKSGLESDTAVSSSLIDAYSKSGYLDLSARLFAWLPSPNVVCFTSIINGYARNGMGKEGLVLFREMIRKGLKPDRVTILCVLAGCNHSGLVKEAKMLFDSMQCLYGVPPDRHHYSCMVDLLGRAGLLYEAAEFLNRGPREDATMWSSFLRSCIVHKNENLARKASKILLELEPDDPAVCLQVSKFYLEIGEFSIATRIRELGMAKKVAREIGRSLIETNNY